MHTPQHPILTEAGLEVEVEEADSRVIYESLLHANHHSVIKNVGMLIRVDLVSVSSSLGQSCLPS